MMKAARQPNCKVIQAISGVAMIAPIDTPEEKMPVGSARMVLGNHSPQALSPAGKMPGSPTPSRKRKPASDMGPRANAVSMLAMDHQATQAVAPRRTPKRSIRRPDTVYMTRYERRKAETILE